MISIRNECKDPHFNLALEEYVLKYMDPDESYILLWQNEPSIIIGRNQNTIEEINAKYVRDNGIHVVRRLSGGGAVYHDLGNLNFTFIVNNEKDMLHNFRKFTEPVIQGLNRLGVKAEFSGRNDIVIDGKKFSGNAQYYYGNRVLHHGTILFNSDLSVVSEALNVKMDKIESKGIKSIRSRVTNIYPYLEKEISIDELKDTLLKFFLQDEDYREKEYILSKEELSVIRGMMTKRYSTWNWNYGESPAFDIEKEKRYEGGKLELKLNVKDGKIQKINIYGDFFGKEDLGAFLKLFTGKEYKEDVIKKELEVINMKEYFTGITPENFIDCMFY